MKLKLRFLVLSVGQACNLKCKNCANFSPYALPEMKTYSLESIIADFETLFAAVDVHYMQIQGGEPLLYKNLHKLIGYLAACNSIEREIRIATNGLITPNDTLMKICSLYNVHFRISNYPQSQNNLMRFVQKCQQWDVPVTMYNFASRKAMWYDCGGLDTPREDDDEIVQERFRNCSFGRHCLTLEDGELHRCSRAKNAYKLQGFESQHGDFVRVRGNKNFYEELKEYITPPLRFETACRYCNGQSRLISPAEQL